MLAQFGVGGIIGLAVGLVAVTYSVIAVIRTTKLGGIRGAALTGTGRILSLKITGVSVNTFRTKRRVCVIGLRVEVPGREPYDATVRQAFGLAEIMGLQPGSIIPVQVAAANPRKVRIDLDQPITPPAAVQGDPANPVKIRFNVNQPTVAALADQYHQTQGAGPVLSAADLLASGQRVPGVLKSFAATGTTPRSLGRTPSRPEFLDAPHYMLEVELQFPNLAPTTGRAAQPVPVSQVPNLAIGLQLACLVDPADPTHRFVVDWDGTPPPRP
jgi:hypothetical protein